MADALKRPLKVFLCHASGDKPAVRDLYKRLVLEGVDAWLDQEKLLPGQDWRLEIPIAVRESDVVVICLSTRSITREGFVQKEIKFALDFAEEKPDGTIFLIPARLEDCPVPEGLSRWQWVNLYEDNGFSKLLRSLKLRADKVNATIEPTYSPDAGRELEERLDQLYMEGLGAFYTEDWEKACQRFQSILNERPHHKNVAEKLAEAEHQRKLARLYGQASEFLRCEDWPGAIRTLEELSHNEVDYKDVPQLLKNAKRQRQLQDLQSEAKALYLARQWQAVVKVFEQIALIDPNYSDPDGLLTSAQKEVAESKRIEQLNILYNQALREMDAGRWLEARGFLEQIVQTQPGFLETERLLKKAETEITRVEEQTWRNDQVNMLHEQAHGLLRSRSWRKALEKIEQIRELDDTFIDKDEIAKEARAELDREEQDAQKQNQLAAMYAEAVRLSKEQKFQEALEKWQAVRALDPKYPDRQWLERTLLRNLKGTNGKITIEKMRLWRRIKLFPALVSLVVLGLIVFIALNPSVLSLVLPMNEYPVRIRIVTTSDWTEIHLQEGGRFEDVKIESASYEATVASYSSGTFALYQPIERADGTNAVELTAEATLTDISKDTNLIIIGTRGCIGQTTVELSRVILRPVLVRTVSWGYDCSGDGQNRHTFEIPIDLFMK